MMRRREDRAESSPHTPYGSRSSACRPNAAALAISMLVMAMVMAMRASN
jgi:hypothetical protein